MQVLDMSQPRISRHLNVLKNEELVEDLREGKRVHYSLRKEIQGKEIKIHSALWSLWTMTEQLLRQTQTP
jgi:DNA-binding transcriptional ArsR family regulator